MEQGELTMATQAQDDDGEEELQSAENEEYEFDHGDSVDKLSKGKNAGALCPFMYGVYCGILLIRPAPRYEVCSRNALWVVQSQVS